MFALTPRRKVTNLEIEEPCLDLTKIETLTYRVSRSSCAFYKQTLPPEVLFSPFALVRINRLRNLN